MHWQSSAWYLIYNLLATAHLILSANWLGCIFISLFWGLQCNKRKDSELFHCRHNIRRNSRTQSWYSSRLALLHVTDVRGGLTCRLNHLTTDCDQAHHQIVP